MVSFDQTRFYNIAPLAIYGFPLNISLWISSQYIEQGRIDAVEVDLKKDVTDPDFFGALFENTLAVMDQLMSVCEQECVVRIYRAAVKHRLDALQSEHSNLTHSLKDAKTELTSPEWLTHYLTAFRELVSDYEALAIKLDLKDEDIEDYRSFIQMLEKSLLA